MGEYVQPVRTPGEPGEVIIEPSLKTHLLSYIPNSPLGIHDR
jgi:hypothetical protein